MLHAPRSTLSGASCWLEDADVCIAQERPADTRYASVHAGYTSTIVSSSTTCSPQYSWVHVVFNVYAHYQLPRLVVIVSID